MFRDGHDGTAASASAADCISAAKRWDSNIVRVIGAPVTSLTISLLSKSTPSSLAAAVTIN